MRIILFSMLLFHFMLAGLAARAQATSCYIMYSYDAAGYRTQRQLNCPGAPGPQLKHTNGPKTGTDSTIISTNATVAPADTIIANICSLYPNPSNGVFKAVLKYPAHEADVYIMDEKGAVISRKKMDGTETNFDIRQYPPGVYVLHLKDKDYEFEAKVVKE